MSIFCCHNLSFRVPFHTFLIVLCVIFGVASSAAYGQATATDAGVTSWSPDPLATWIDACASIDPSLGSPSESHTKDGDDDDDDGEEDPGEYEIIVEGLQGPAAGSSAAPGLRMLDCLCARTLTDDVGDTLSCAAWLPSETLLAAEHRDAMDRDVFVFAVDGAASISQAFDLLWTSEVESQLRLLDASGRQRALFHGKPEASHAWEFYLEPGFYYLEISGQGSGHYGLHFGVSKVIPGAERFEN